MSRSTHAHDDNRKGRPQFPALHNKASVQNRIREIAHEANKLYFGQRLTTVTVLSGASIFAADFQKSLDEGVAVKQEFVKMTSYRGGISSGSLETRYDLLDENSVRGQHTLILDDILDSGKTMYHLQSRLLAMRPASLRIAVLLRKEGTLDPSYPVRADFVGFDIPNVFVVGCGMDYQGMYRNLRYVAEFDLKTHGKFLSWLDRRDDRNTPEPDII